MKTAARMLTAATLLASGAALAQPTQRVAQPIYPATRSPAPAAIGAPVTPGGTVLPPPNQPHAFTPAPVPNVGNGSVRPARRAGGAADAGPVDSTPLSGSIAPGLAGSTSSQTNRTTDQTGTLTTGIPR